MRLDSTAVFVALGCAFAGCGVNDFDTSSGTTDPCSVYGLKPMPSGCACVAGAQRACYSGPALSRNVGPCHAGTQQCANGQWRPCLDEIMPVAEQCDDGIDNNCNGRVDEEGCAGESDHVAWLRHALQPAASGIAPVGALKLLERVSGFGSCPAGTVFVEMEQGTACADPPPLAACPAHQALDYSMATGVDGAGALASGWGCRACDLIVQFGSRFGSVRQCATTPSLDCPDGQVPTFVAESDQWECRPRCDNGDYDVRTLPTLGTVCVPC